MNEPTPRNESQRIEECAICGEPILWLRNVDVVDRDERGYDHCATPRDSPLTVEDSYHPTHWHHVAPGMRVVVLSDDGC